MDKFDMVMVFGPGFVGSTLIDPPDIEEYLKYLEYGGEDRFNWKEKYDKKLKGIHVPGYTEELSDGKRFMNPHHEIEMIQNKNPKAK